MRRQITLSDVHRNLTPESREEFLNALSSDQLSALMAQAETVEEDDAVSKEDKVNLLLDMLRSFADSNATDTDDKKENHSSIEELTEHLKGLTLQDTLVHKALVNDSTSEDLVTQEKNGYFSGRLGSLHVPVAISGKGMGCLPTSFLTYLLNDIPLFADNRDSSEFKDTTHDLNDYASSKFKDIFIEAMKRSRENFTTKIGGFECSSDSFEPDTLARPLIIALDVKKYKDVVDFFAQDALLWLCHSKMPGLKYEGDDQRVLATTFMRLVTHVPVVRLVNRGDVTVEEKRELDSNERLAGHCDLAAFSAVFDLACDNYWILPQHSETNQGQTLKFAGRYNESGAQKKINLLYTFGEVGHFDLLLPSSEYQSLYAGLDSEKCTLLISALKERCQERKKAFEKIIHRSAAIEEIAPKGPKGKIDNLHLAVSNKITSKVQDAVLKAQKKEAALLGVDVPIKKEEMPAFICEHVCVHLNNLGVFVTAIEERYKAIIEYLQFIQTLFSLEDMTIDENNFIKMSFTSTNAAESFAQRLEKYNGLRYAIGCGVENRTVTIAHENEQGFKNTVDLLYHALPLPDFQSRLERVSKIGPYRKVLVLHQPESQPAAVSSPMTPYYSEESTVIEIDGEWFMLSGPQKEVITIAEGIEGFKRSAVGDSADALEARKTLAEYKTKLCRLGSRAAEVPSLEAQFLECALKESLRTAGSEFKNPQADPMTLVDQPNDRKRSSNVQETSERVLKRLKKNPDESRVSSSSGLFQSASSSSLPKDTDDDMSDEDPKRPPSPMS